MMLSSPGTNFNSSRLVRFLAELAIVDVAESKQAFAERLGQWLDFADAIALHAVHDSASAMATRTGGAEAHMLAAPTALADEFAAARTAWANSLTASCSAQADKWPSPDADVETAAAYEPYRRFYAARQGEMEVAIRPWRNKARQALAQRGGKLGQLAALDGAFDRVFGARERQLLASVPALLGKRFALLAGGGIADFGKELTMVLLAELDLRLQPTVGLIEALSNEAG